MYLKHGMTRTKEYSAWRSMKYRCRNPRSRAYPRYGGRGVIVCPRWVDSFEAFFADLGPAPSGTWLDRIDNDGNYEPGNCRWATPMQQGNNRSSNRVISALGRQATISQFSREAGVSWSTLFRRLETGWPLEEAVSVPPVSPHRSRCAGEENGNAVLSWTDVDQIRRRYAAGESQRSIAPDYGIHQVTVSKIVTGQRWKECGT